MSDMPDYVHAVYTSVKNTWQDAENLDDTHGYTSYIWIPEETFKVDVMRLAVFAEKFRAYSKSALAGGAQTKTSGASSASTSAENGGHYHAVTGATSSEEEVAHTHNVVIGTKTSTANIPHQHVMFYYASNTPGGYAERQHQAFKSPTQLIGADLKTSEALNLTTFIENAVHTHDVDYGTKTSASGGNWHTHTVSGQTTGAIGHHTHGMAHTHSVTIDNHTHPIDFGIYEEAITGRTLSAILYNPDGTLLKNFSVILTGEDNDILDLTEYFQTLKYGMYRLVLSASGRLRARLVFYELCKMYAQF